MATGYSRITMRRIAPQALWARRLAGFSFILLMVASIGHRYQHVATPAFLALFALVGLLALAALILAAIALRCIWIEDDYGTGRAIFAGLIALIVLAPHIAGLAAGLTHPMVADVATDISDPPELIGAERAAFGMNQVDAITAEEREAIAAAYPELAGRAYLVPMADVVSAVLKVAEQRGWQPTARRQEPDGSLLLGYQGYSAVLGFVSDIAVRITPEAGTAKVDVRSASRWGYNDFGENAARITNFLNALDAEIKAMQEAAIE